MGGSAADESRSTLSTTPVTTNTPIPARRISRNPRHAAESGGATLERTSAYVRVPPTHVAAVMACASRRMPMSSSAITATRGADSRLDLSNQLPQLVLVERTDPSACEASIRPDEEGLRNSRHPKFNRRFAAEIDPVLVAHAVSRQKRAEVALRVPLADTEKGDVLRLVLARHAGKERRFFLTRHAPARPEIQDGAPASNVARLQRRAVDEGEGEVGHHGASEGPRPSR